MILRTHFFPIGLPISGFLLVIFLLMLCHSESQGETYAESQPCGSSVEDKLTQARLALENSTTEHRAIECLIDAVAKLDADKSSALREDGNRVLVMPSITGPLKHD